MKRIQRKRTKGWHMPPNAIYVGRPTKWCNPYSIGGHTVYERTIALKFYKKWLKEKLRNNPHFLDELSKKDLACWCPLDKQCHADILLKEIEEMKWLQNSN